MLTPTSPPTSFLLEASAPPATDSVWERTCKRFLAAVPDEARSRVELSLHRVHRDGSGLRDWVTAIAWRGAELPDAIPECIIEVYLADPEAAPLHDCEECGMAVPVRPSRLYGMEGEPEEEYFPECPVCGARTGPFMHFTRSFEGNRINPLRRRPR